MSSISEVQAERVLFQDQLELVEGQLHDNPENAELKSLQAELKQMISLLDESLAELKQKEQPKPTASTIPKSGGFKKVALSTATPEIHTYTANEPINFQVNDTVNARWVSGDRGWYPARITTITGSATAPMYTVKFKSYDTVETLRIKDVRPLANKRKADGSLDDDGTFSHTMSNSAALVVPSLHFSSLPGSSAAAPTAGTVISAAASLYPDQVAKMTAQKEGTEGEKPHKAKKIKANKELEAGKSKWQEFTKSKFAKTHKKDSMFRTPEGVNGRVGFIGSGKAMRKDVARTRHIYQQADDD